MRKFTFLMVILIAFSYVSIGQSGWNQVDSGLPNAKGIGQMSVGMDDMTAIWGAAINDDGSVYDAFTRSTDGGATWEAGTFNLGDGLSQVFAIDALTCWAVFNTGASQGLYKTIDGGTTWEKKGGVYGGSSFANVIHFFNDMDGFAQGDPVDGYYELYTTTDGGETWVRVPEVDIPVPTSGEYGITGNYCAVGDDIWWGTNKGRIFRSMDKGYTWEAALTAHGDAKTVGSIMFDALNGISYPSYLDAGIAEFLNVTDDGGVTWTEFVPAGAAFSRYFWHMPGTENTLIGSAMDIDAGMGISISEDGGYTWTEMSSGYPFMASVWFSMDEGYVGTLTSGTPSMGGMYIYGNPPAPVNLQATVSVLDVELTWEAPEDPAVTSFSDDFEGHEDFVIDFSPWVNLDVDGSATYGMTGTEWPNAYTEQAFIIFNPSQTVPALEDIIPHSGDKFAACFASVTPANDDWMIAPQVNIVAGATVSFWAKSYTADYGLERFKVGVSTTGMNPGDFTIITPGSYVEAPVEDWTEFSYALDDYVGQNVYVAIECVSNDAFILLVDDFTVGVTKSNFVFNAPSPIVGKGVKEIGEPTGVTIPSSLKAPLAINELVGYNVYRNAVKINAEVVAELTYTDMEVPIGSFEYYVTAVYSGGESDPSNIVTIIVTDMEEFESSSIQVYPNPVRNLLNIKADNIVNVKVISITGQLVLDNEMTGNTAVIDVNDLTPGVYFVNIETQNGSVSRKIMVE